MYPDNGAIPYPSDGISQMRASEPPPTATTSNVPTGRSWSVTPRHLGDRRRRRRGSVAIADADRDVVLLDGAQPVKSPFVHLNGLGSGEGRPGEFAVGIDLEVGVPGPRLAT